MGKWANNNILRAATSYRAPIRNAIKHNTVWFPTIPTGRILSLILSQWLVLGENFQNCLTGRNTLFFNAFSHILINKYHQRDDFIRYWHHPINVDSHLHDESDHDTIHLNLFTTGNVRSAFCWNTPSVWLCSVGYECVVFVPHAIFIFLDEFLLVLLIFHPVLARDDKVRCYSTLWTRSVKKKKTWRYKES